MIQTLKLLGLVILAMGIVFIYVIYRRKKKNARSTLFLIFSLSSLIALYKSNIENLILRYDSPEEAFLNSGHKGTIEDMIDTENSTMVIFKNGSADQYLLLSKDNGKWKAPLNYSNYYNNVSYTNIITAYGEKNTNNYYIIILARYDVESITDNRNSDFIFYELGSYSDRYVAFVDNMDADYTITINDIDINIPNYLNIDFN